MEQAEALAAALEPVMVRAGHRCAPAGLERLSGGANMESWRFTCGGESFVLRRAPSLAFMKTRPLQHAQEAELIRRAVAGGVRAPRIVAELAPEDELGSGFVMEALPGTASPPSILADPPPTLVGEIAQSLAAIHALDPATLDFLPRVDPAASIEALAAEFAEYSADRPIIALGLAWLRAHVPPPTEPRAVHGDFRLGNLMVADGRLSGVLDWELAHLGDRHEDLAYGCLTVWRFGRLDHPAFGLADLDTYFAAYRAAGGDAVDPQRFRFWLVERTVWWALGCIRMGTYWRNRTARAVERVVIGRRAAEQELDLLLLLEEDAPPAERERPLPPPPSPPPPREGEPSAAEIVTAVGEWLAQQKDRFAGPEGFDLAVARNALGIVGRELESRPDPHDRALAAAILAGEQGLDTPGLLARLRRDALATLAADQPKYPALARARTLWETA